MGQTRPVRTMNLELCGLDPVVDAALFREAFDWRAKQKLNHLRPKQMPFEVFAGDDRLVMGLFNGQFLAAYVAKEYAPGFWDMHFTSKRNTPREYLVAGGVGITSHLIEKGAQEVSALIVARNRPLREFLGSCGYALDRVMRFSDSPYQWLRYVA